RRFQHRTDRPTRDDASALGGGLEIHPRRAEMAGDLTRDGRVLQRYEDQILLGVLHRLADGLGHLACLAETDTHVAVTVADDDERREGKSPTALDHLRDPVDRNHPVREIQRTRIDTRFSHSTPPVWTRTPIVPPERALSTIPVRIRVRPSAPPPRAP